MEAEIHRLSREEIDDMRSLRCCILLLLSTALLVGCGMEKEPMETDPSDAGRGDASESTLQTEEKQPLLDDTGDRIKVLEIRTWQDISGDGISAEEAMLNSCRENLGYLAWSGDGEAIYYSDLAVNKIYFCTAEGEEKTCLCENAGLYLQVRDGWLYARIRDENKIVKISCETGECVDVFTEPCGEFFFLQDKLYINTEDGFCVYNEGNGSRTYYGHEFEMTNIQLCRNIILAHAIKGEDTSFFLKGYLLGYDIAEE